MKIERRPHDTIVLKHVFVESRVDLRPPTANKKQKQNRRRATSRQWSMRSHLDNNCTSLVSLVHQKQSNPIQSKMVSNRVLNSFLWFTILLQLLTHAASTVHQSSSRASSDNGGAPWQKSGDSRSIIEESTYEDLPPTIFSPNGRLHSIERVVRASKIPNNPRSNLLLALKCKEGLVVLTTLTTSPFLNTTVNSNLWLVEDNQTATTSTSPILDLGPASGLLVATAGNTVDGQVLRQKIQAYAEYNLEQEKDTIEAYVLARNIADHLQANTQTVGGRDGRMLAVRISSQYCF